MLTLTSGMCVLFGRFGLYSDRLSLGAYCAGMNISNQKKNNLNKQKKIHKTPNYSLYVRCPAGQRHSSEIHHLLRIKLLTPGNSFWWNKCFYKGTG